MIKKIKDRVNKLKKILKICPIHNKKLDKFGKTFVCWDCFVDDIKRSIKNRVERVTNIDG